MKIIKHHLSDSDQQNLLDGMRSFAVSDPQVGIFWYDDKKKVLFGIDKESPIGKPPVLNGKCTTKTLHPDLWRKRFNEHKYKKLKGVNPFVGNYMDVARGRIFYVPATKSYEIMVGEWIHEFPETIDLILEEFNLLSSNYEFIENPHWNRGCGFEW
jgi:hypothetical protein